MNQERPRRLVSFIQGFAIVLISAIISNAAATALVIAWTGPSSSPPAGNVARILHVGSEAQVKDANLGVNGLAVFGNTLLWPGSYLNWGTTAGASGYGIRDNGGLLEFKTATGTWQSIQAIITTSVGSSTSWQPGPNGSVYYSAGNVGIGMSSAPVAVLSVAGAMRLAPRTAAPVACDASHIGSIAISDATSHICICNGSAWVYDYNGAACFWGSVTPGSQSYTIAGTYTFTVPAYNTLTVQVWGGGGGGGGAYAGGNGGNGGPSSLNSMIVTGGAGGNRGAVSATATAAGGTGSGGTTNLTGGEGGSSSSGGSNSGAGGAGANGGAGGASAPWYSSGNAGFPPGGGGSGGSNHQNPGGYVAGAGGGGGGYSSRTYIAGELTAGSTISLTVGAGGADGTGTYAGGSGAVGRVTIIWD